MLFFDLTLPLLFPLIAHLSQRHSSHRNYYRLMDDALSLCQSNEDNKASIGLHVVREEVQLQQLHILMTNTLEIDKRFGGRGNRSIEY